jgi:hypothetical protein
MASSPTIESAFLGRFNAKMLFLICILIAVQTVIRAGEQHFCEVEEKKEQNCSKNFDILEEYSRALEEWKVDIKKLKKEKHMQHLNELVNEIRQRLENNVPCPFIRTVKKCCNGFSGPNCDVPVEGTTTKKPEKSEADKHRDLPYATCLLWGKDHYRTFDGSFYHFNGK